MNYANDAMKNRYRGWVAAGLGLAIVLGLAGGASAWAQAGGAGGIGLGLGGAGGGTATPSCADPTLFPKPIILTGSSAFEPTASYFAAKAAALATPYTVIYNATGSCSGLTAVQGHVALTATGDVYKTVDANGKPVKTTCQIDATPMYADIGVSDVFYDSCMNSPLPATVTDTQGPVQAMLPIVAAANASVQAISAEQAAAIWGCGAASKVGMFTDATSANGTQQRSATSGTQILMAKNIGVDAAAFMGHANSTGGALIASMTAGAAAEPMQVIGFVAADSYKGALATTPPAPIRALAFRGLMQTKAYYADSTASSFDRRNVRDGHYVVAGPEHLFTLGAPSANAQQFLNWMNGVTMIDGNANTWIDLTAAAGTIPQCAMKVTHTADGGFMTPYTPPAPCGCYFESKATGVAAPAGCTACSTTVPCATGTCSFGFCE